MIELDLGVVWVQRIIMHVVILCISSFVNASYLRPNLICCGLP